MNELVDRKNTKYLVDCHFNYIYVQFISEHKSIHYWFSALNCYVCFKMRGTYMVLQYKRQSPYCYSERVEYVLLYRLKFVIELKEKQVLFLVRNGKKTHFFLCLIKNIIIRFFKTDGKSVKNYSKQSDAI